MNEVMALLVGALILMAIMMLVVSAILLWTGLVMGSMFASWYRQQCITDDTGVETGAYTYKRTADGKQKRVPISEEQAKLDMEADELLTETEDKAIWNQASNRRSFWADYMA